MEPLAAESGRGRDGNIVELAPEVGRNTPALAGVSGKLTGHMPETVASRPYSGLRQLLNSKVLGRDGHKTRITLQAAPSGLLSSA